MVDAITAWSDSGNNPGEKAATSAAFYGMMANMLAVVENGLVVATHLQNDANVKSKGWKTNCAAGITKGVSKLLSLAATGYTYRACADGFPQSQFDTLAATEGIRGIDSVVRSVSGADGIADDLTASFKAEEAKEEAKEAAKEAVKEEAKEEAKAEETKPVETTPVGEDEITEGEAPPLAEETKPVETKPFNSDEITEDDWFYR
mmetsp:Transcript_41664/g.84090  ORF Transcript_41664/g.84090 Transcript_41664/m.84090 type:complete len:204 (-) Transcript_41664:164-775(-)